jgi:hypothetical protein
VRRTFKDILAEYGAVALVVYLTIFAVVLFSFWAAISMGWKPASAVGSVGAFTAAYIATKVTQPLRIAATLALTPIVARIYERVTGKSGRVSVSPNDERPGAG